MSYRFKGQKVIINGKEQVIVPETLPENPSEGYFCIDIVDGKFKVFNQLKNKWLILGDAADIQFNNQGNGFNSNNVQSAIEEVKIINTYSRFSIIATFNGTINHNQWLGYNELLPGDKTPIIIPKNCKLQEVTFSWNSSISIAGNLVTIVTDVDGRFELYKNGLTNKIWETTFLNSGSGEVKLNLNLSLNSGDFLIAKWVDLGNNPSDMAIGYFFQPI